MTYQEAMDFLEDTKKYGSVLGLDSIRALMKQLGDVQEQISVIHVAGTNGKGSTCAFLSSIYGAAGYHVGRFSTPDVFSYEEEFLYNDVPIEKEELAKIFSVVKDACEKLVLAGLPHPTRFEVETAAAFLWFYNKKADMAIVEVGMGGETDATNVITSPIASVLASISMDHMGFLGKNLKDIAAVKAGIVKNNCPVFSTWQEPEVETVIRNRAKECNSTLVFVDKTSVAKEFDYQISLQGEFQKQNAMLAVEVVRGLQEVFPVSEAHICKGLAMAKWPGRFEQIGSEPLFYIDGAHNIDAAKKLRQTIDAEFSDQRVIYIMGVLEDKDYEEIAEIMFTEGDIVYAVTPNNPRALSARELCDVLLELDVRGYECKDVKMAVETAMELAELSDGVVVAFGSLSYLKEAKEAHADACLNKKDNEI